MNRSLLVLLSLAGAFLPSVCPAQAPAPAPAAPGPAAPLTAEEMTVITSQKLVYDYRNRFAVFDGNVVVIDPGMKLTADKLTVRFDVDNQIQFIEARGQVYIEQTERNLTARAEKITYHVKEGKIVMEENPQVVREQNILRGGTIIYWRLEDRLESFGGTQTIFPSDEKKRGEASLPVPRSRRSATP